MIVDVEVRSGQVTLLEPEDLHRFHVQADGDAEAVATALGDRGYRAEAPDHVFVRIETLRALAADRVEPDWAAGFQKMLAYAKSRGWLDEEETHVLAHVERR